MASQKTCDLCALKESTAQTAAVSQVVIQHDERPPVVKDLCEAHYKTLVGIFGAPDSSNQAK